MKYPVRLTHLSLCLVGLLSLQDAAAARPSPAEGGRPNVLFILVDDQSPFDLKVYDPKSPLETPTLDKLAAEGMVFDAAYHMGSFSGAVCSPSRHMIMSGRTVWRLPNAPGAIAQGRCPPDLEQQTLPAVFNRAGYATMRTCKIGNSYEAANKLFQVRRDATKRGGDDQSGSAWHAEQVLDYLRQREASKDTRPFLIYYGFSHPHDIRDGKPELLAKYGAVNHADPDALPPAHPKQPPLPANYLPAHPFQHGHDDVRDEVAVSIQYDVHDGRVRRNQLFNLADNPHEFLAEHHDPQVIARTGAVPARHQIDLADDPAHAAKLKEMQNLLLAEMRRLEYPWRLWNQPDDGLAPPPAPLPRQPKAKRVKPR